MEMGAGIEDTEIPFDRAAPVYWRKSIVFLYSTRDGDQ